MGNLFKAAIGIGVGVRPRGQPMQADARQTRGVRRSDASASFPDPIKAACQRLAVVAGGVKASFEILLWESLDPPVARILDPPYADGLDRYCIRYSQRRTLAA
jgi:hypothetical protein